MAVEKLWNFIIKKVLLQIHFGHGAARIRNNFFLISIRILLKVSDPTGSGSTTLQKSWVQVL
jgi:hypothetical protein